MSESFHSFASAGDSAIFPVENDDTLGRLIALFLHSRLFGGESRKRGTFLHELGWQDSLVSEMSEMPIDDVAKVLSSSNSCLGVIFDHRKAAAVVNSYRALKRDEDELNYFIVNGATPQLIRQLFPKVSARLVAQQRKQLGYESKGGRPPLPDTETSYAIYRSWKLLCTSESDLRQRYKRLKEQYPNFTLATLSATVDSA